METENRIGKSQTSILSYTLAICLDSEGLNKFVEIMEILYVIMYIRQ